MQNPISYHLTWTGKAVTRIAYFRAKMPAEIKSFVKLKPSCDTNDDICAPRESKTSNFVKNSYSFGAMAYEKGG